MRAAAVLLAGYGVLALAEGFGVRGVFSALAAGILLALRDARLRDRSRL